MRFLRKNDHRTTLRGSLSRVVAMGLVGLSSSVARAAPFNTIDAHRLTTVDAGAKAMGYCAAFDGDTALLGAVHDTITQPMGGSAYFFVPDGAGGWIQQQKVDPADVTYNDNFGVSCAIQGATAVIGSYGHNGLTGAVYVYTRLVNGWSLEQELFGSDVVAGDLFGQSVAIDGNTLVVGAFFQNSNQGATYVFSRNGGMWTQAAKLLASDGSAGNRFGNAVAMQGTTLLVGAREAGPTGAGQVYVFEKFGSSWVEQTRLANPSPVAGAYFGDSVALHGTTALVGETHGNGSKGSAFAFVGSGASWTYQAQLSSADGVVGDLMGASVALGDDVAVVGAPAKGNEGATYVFARQGVTWTQQDKLISPMHQASGSFGNAVGVWGNTVLSAAQGEDSNFGAGYLFRLEGGLGALCVSSIPCQANSVCADGVCCNSACGNGDPNDCQACSIPQGAAADGTCEILTSAHTCGAALDECHDDAVCGGMVIDCPASSIAANGTSCEETGACFNGACVGGAGAAGTGGTGGTSGAGGTSATGGANGTAGDGGGTDGSSGVGGASGMGGTGGAAGGGGTAGGAGSAGAAALGGTAGDAGNAGTGATGGTGGQSGIGGASGTSGESGSAGTNGTAGVSGSSGSSGAAGSGATGGTSGTAGSAGTVGLPNIWGSGGTIQGASAAGTAGGAGDAGATAAGNGGSRPAAIALLPRQSSDDGGCSCQTPAGSTSSRGLVAGAIGALAWAARRRRK